MWDFGIFKKITLLLMGGMVMGLTGGCGGGGSGGGGGSSGAVAGVTATAPQTALWVVSLTYLLEDITAISAIKQNFNTYNQAFLISQNDACSNGGSMSASGSPGSINFVASNCLNNSITANGSVDLSWNPNYSSGSCLGINYPTNLTYQYSFTNNFSLSSANPTELLSGNGGLTLAESAPTCSASSFTIPFTVSVSSGPPLTIHFIVTSPTLSTSFDGTINTLNETVTGTYNSSFQATNTNYSFSGTFTLPNSSGIYSFSSSNTAPFVIDYAISSGVSSGVLNVTGPNETDVLTITGPDQVTVTTTINGVSKTTSETLASFLGAS